MSARHNNRTVRGRAVRSTPARHDNSTLQSAAGNEYRLLFALNPCPMWIFDETTLEFLAVNEAAIKLYGWSDEEFLRMTVKDVRPPEEVPKLLKALARQRGSRVAFIGEWRHWKKDHTLLDVEVTVSCIPFQGRDARLTLINDVTDRKRVEMELKEFNATLEQRVAERTGELTRANQHLRAVMDSAFLGILTLDEEGKIETVNQAASQIFGCPPPEILGANVSQFVALPNQPAQESFLSHYLQTGNKQGLGVRDEVLGRHKDGHAMILEFALAEVAHPERRQFVAMVWDITKRKCLERELLETGERERQRLGHDLHDGLGQHLHALYYMASLLEKELGNTLPEQAREAGRLAQQLEHGLELIRSLARGLQPVNAVPEGLMLALRELAGRTRTLYRVDCRFQCRSAVLVHWHTAANHLYRIAQEAVNNAMKHGKPTRIRIRLADMGEKVILGIRDNGIGIREQNARSHGMGLRVMQFRADALRGSLAVQKHPQGGTEVVCSVAREALVQQQEGRS